MATTDQAAVQFYNPYITSKGPSLGQLTDDLTALIARNMPSATRRDSILSQRETLSTVVANIALASLSPFGTEHGTIAVPLSRPASTRYDRGDVPKYLLAPTLAALEDECLIRREPPIFKEKCSHIEPTSSMVHLLGESRASLSDIGRHAGEEPIRLSALTGRKAFGGSVRPKVLIDYRDTNVSRYLRAEMLKVNGFLNGFQIAYDDKPQAPPFLHRSFTLRSSSDPISFKLNGRLFGAGFWLWLSKSDRHRITLDGESIVDLDWSAAFGRLAYWYAGLPPPKNDPYAIPGLENHRAGAKLALLSLLSRSSPMRQLSPELRKELPKDWTAQRLVEAASGYHRGISHLWGKDLGLELMNIESNLMVELLLRLDAAGLPALPLHDGVLTPARSSGRTAEIMSAVAKEILGVGLPVAMKTPTGTLQL